MHLPANIQRHTISKRKATTAGLGQNMKIQVLNADGQTIEQWDLQNPFVKSVKFGDLSYEDDALRTVELGIRYDWAVCTFGALQQIIQMMRNLQSRYNSTTNSTK